MAAYRKLLIVPAVVFAFSSIAGANSITIGPLTTSTPIASRLTDWTGTLAFAQFDSTLGTLNSVTFDISGSLTTTLTVRNNASSASSGTANTELEVSIEDAGDNLGFLNDTPEVSNNPTINQFSPNYHYSLASGVQTASGLLSSNYNSGALTYTLSAILNEFSNPGGGTVDLSAGTFTQTVLANSGGNTSATQVTDASLTGTVTYNYTANVGNQNLSNAPEPATMAMMGGALIGLGLFRRRFRKR